MEKRNNKVYKTDKYTSDAVSWYRIASKYFNTPKIESVIGNTMCMEYIEHNGEPNVFEAVEILKKMKKIPAINAPFETYQHRIADHLKINTMLNDYEKESIMMILKKWEDAFNSESSFSHGDFSIDNLLNHDGEIYLIDPIYIDGLYSSWVLDAGKLLHSLKRYDKKEEYDVVFNSLDKLKILKIAELTQWIRVWKYADDELKKKCINEIRTLIKEIEI